MDGRRKVSISENASWKVTKGICVDIEKKSSHNSSMVSDKLGTTATRKIG